MRLLNYLSGLFLVAVLLSISLASCREDDVTDTNNWVVAVNAKAPKAKYKIINLTGSTQVNGSVTGYFIDGDLAKGSLSIFSEMGRKIENYYFKNGNLVCVQKQDFIYNKPQYYNEETALKNGDSVWYEDSKTIMKTSLFYFYDDRLVKWINENKKLVPETDRAYEITTKTILSDADRLQKMFRE